MPIHTIVGGDGLRLAVHEYGQPHGKPILLIHGFSACHLVWSKQHQSPLANEFRLVCLDNRGHGMSEKPTGLEHYTQDALWADDIHAVIAGLALRKPILGGWSYGGFIINDYLAKYGQDTVGGINYVGAAVLMGIERAANMFGSGFTDNAAGLCSDNLDENIRALRPFLRAVFAKQPSQEDFEVMVAFSMVVPPAVRLGLVSRTIDRDHVMKALTIPVLVTEGAKDGLVLASHTQHLLSCIAQAKHSRYEDIGHAPPMEDSERFNRELAEFARQHAG
jgi:non-heme chloroperoxidase